MRIQAKRVLFFIIGFLQKIKTALFILLLFALLMRLVLWLYGGDRFTTSSAIRVTYKSHNYTFASRQVQATLERHKEDSSVYSLKIKASNDESESLLTLVVPSLHETADSSGTPVYFDGGPTRTDESTFFSFSGGPRPVWGTLCPTFDGNGGAYIMLNLYQHGNYLKGTIEGQVCDLTKGRDSLLNHIMVSFNIKQSLISKI